MSSYSNEELVDMLIVYRAADWNGHANRWLYQERSRNRRVPHHMTFASVNRRLLESGSNHKKSLVCKAPVPLVENLIAEISVAAFRIRDMPGIFENIRCRGRKGIESELVQELQHQVPYVEGSEDATLSNYSDFLSSSTCS
ncbi:hypothetical protein TNCV_4829471 [Trichonephila clavipes]|nr:hypothetical protein TNCV_4829471 [Trichonephila clavipes]